MSGYRRRELPFNPTCPSGGTWYSCASGSHFIGCCTSDPCTNGCFQGNLRPVTFDTAYYGKFPDGSCGTGSLFYTCPGTNPPFWGCCKTPTNPCSEGACPNGDLVAAFMDLPEQMSAYSPTGGPSSTATSTLPSTTISKAVSVNPTSSLADSSASVSATGTAAATSPGATVTVGVVPSGQNKGSTSHTGAIAGGAAGGAVVIAIIIGILIYYILHARKSRNLHQDTIIQRQSDLPAVMPEKPNGGVSQTGYVPTPFPPMAPPMCQYDPNSDAYQQQPTGYQELPVSPTSPQGSWMQQHSHRLSELSGETARLSAAGSPIPPSPHAFRTPQSPQSTMGEGPNWTTHPWHGQQVQRGAAAQTDQIHMVGHHPSLSGYHGR